jgi:hypothetical protein
MMRNNNKKRRREDVNNTSHISTFRELGSATGMEATFFTLPQELLDKYDLNDLRVYVEPNDPRFVALRVKPAKRTTEANVSEVVFVVPPTPKEWQRAFECYKVCVLRLKLFIINNSTGLQKPYGLLWFYKNKLLPTEIIKFANSLVEYTQQSTILLVALYIQEFFVHNISKQQNLVVSKRTKR